MKKYKQLLSFGCSFTEGGGLNSSEYHRRLDKMNGIILPNEHYDTHNYQEYMTQHSYPSFLAKKLNCDFYNYGISCGSNEIIIKTLYDVLNGELDSTHMLNYREDLKGKRFVSDEDYENTLITIQFSLLNRIMVYRTDTHLFEPLNGIYHHKDYINTFYKMYISHFYNSRVEYKKTLQYMDVYSEYLKSKNIDYLFTWYETPSNFIKKSKTIVSFNGCDLNRFVNGEKFRLLDDEKLNFYDHHFTIEGNKIIADKFYEHICEYYD